MCIVLWTLGHPAYQLVLISNRDEYLSRPTMPAQWHPFHPAPPPIPSPNRSTSPPSKDAFLGGLDLSAFGTWLGITPTGRIGLLTNVAEPADKSKPSRGSLVRDFLTSDETFTSYAQSVDAEKQKYAGFNLVVGQLGQESAGLAYLSNREDTDLGVQRLDDVKVQGGMDCCARGVSNNTLADDEWVKVKTGERLLDETMREAGHLPEDELIDRLFHILETTDPETDFPPSNILIRPLHRPAPSSPDSAPSEPLSLSPATWYATRTQAIVLVPRASATSNVEDGGREGELKVRFVERDAFKLVEGGVGEDGTEPRFVGGDKSLWRSFSFALDVAHLAQEGQEPSKPSQGLVRQASL